MSYTYMRLIIDQVLAMSGCIELLGSIRGTKDRVAVDPDQLRGVTEEDLHA